MTADRDARFQSLAESLLERLGPISEAVVERIRAEVPAWTVDRPELGELLASGAPASIGAELRALVDGATLPDACPPIDAEGARVAARAGVPLSILVYLYRLGHSAQWEAWFELVEESGADAAERAELVRRGSRFFFAYADRLSAFVTEEYTQERDRLLRSQEQRRVHLVRELLAARDVDRTLLGYDVEQHHIGLVVWGEEAARAVRELAAVLDRNALLVDVVEQTWWAWLGGPAPLGERAIEVLRRPRMPAGVGVAIGNDARGLAGFRRTHEQAVAAQKAASRTGAAAVSYDDVALETLALHDQPRAREFVERELAGLDADDARSVRLRETLGAYFASGHNAATAAAAIGMHEQTVAQRLRAVERRTGRPVAARRAELEVALRLRRYFDAGP